jgi:hypothetical protein
MILIKNELYLKYNVGFIKFFFFYKFYMKKNLTIFFNCHGNYISFYLKKFLNSDFNVNFIYIADFDGGGGKRKYFNEKEINIFKNTDILIVQYIKNDRHFLNHSKVISLVKKDAIIIKIPHYTYHGYNFKFISDNILKNLELKNDFKKIKNIIDKKFETNIDNHDINEYRLTCLEKIKKNDEVSDIKMYDLFKKYYKDKILFNEPWHPNSFFIYLMVIEILNHLNVNSDKKYINVFEIFSKMQFNITKKNIEYMSIINNLSKDYIYEKIKNKDIELFENYLHNDLISILYKRVNYDIHKNNIISIKRLKTPNDNIIEVNTTDKVLYISKFMNIKIDIKYYLYFHSDLLYSLNEVNEKNINIYKKHPSCCLLNEKNLKIMNKFECSPKNLKYLKNKMKNQIQIFKK